MLMRALDQLMWDSAGRQHARTILEARMCGLKALKISADTPEVSKGEVGYGCALQRIGLQPAAAS